VYAKTALILNYDEGGQFFDHAFTPTPPLTDAEGVSTVDTENEINRETLLPDGVDAAPNGLGYRVPLLIISPWTRGNIVYSEVTDHVSVIKFLEKRFDIACPNLSPWRRAMVGDLTAAFDFESTPDYSWPRLPDTSDYARKADAECLTLPDIVVPTEQSMPKQVRLERAKGRSQAFWVKRGKGGQGEARRGEAKGGKARREARWCCLPDREPSEKVLPTRSRAKRDGAACPAVLLPRRSLTAYDGS
jgi:phospholipase C